MKVRIIAAPAIAGMPRKITQYFLGAEIPIVDPSKTPKVDGYVTKVRWIITIFDHSDKFWLADWLRFSMKSTETIVIPKESCELIEDSSPQPVHNY